MLMELVPDMENIVFIDEYPHLAQKLRLQRLARPALISTVSEVVELNMPTPPDDAA